MAKHLLGSNASLCATDTAKDVAAVVAMVATNAFMTRQTVQVNGGMHFD
jgi:hypothetical protein